VRRFKYICHQIGGKIRRYYFARFRKRYSASRVQGRQGQCIRCGACCKLVFRCPFLVETLAGSTCVIHKARPGNCRVFPMDARDIQERNMVAGNTECGYRFDDIE
jgi:Fe-S-cluster containining protein